MHLFDPQVRPSMNLKLASLELIHFTGTIRYAKLRSTQLDGDQINGCLHDLCHVHVSNPIK